MEFKNMIIKIIVVITIIIINKLMDIKYFINIIIINIFIILVNKIKICYRLYYYLC